jgi:hypothetical protein
MGGIAVGSGTGALLHAAIESANSKPRHLDVVENFRITPFPF